jgi:hypothetical protein
MDSRSFVVGRIVAAASCVTVLVSAYLYAPFVHRGPVVCLMHGLIGLPCPSCGLTRAFCRLARLDLAGALACNALGIPLFGLFLATPAVAVYEICTQRWSRFHALLYSHRAGSFSATVIIAYHLLRVGLWLDDGTLVRDYVRTSWTFALLQTLGFLG